MSRFSIKVNDGDEQEIEVATGLYVSAAAAVPALLGINEFPVLIEIWVPELQPDYPPLLYKIEDAGGRACQMLLRPPLDCSAQSTTFSP